MYLFHGVPYKRIWVYRHSSRSSGLSLPVGGAPRVILFGGAWRGASGRVSVTSLRGTGDEFSPEFDYRRSDLHLGRMSTEHNMLPFAVLITYNGIGSYHLAMGRFSFLKVMCSDSFAIWKTLFEGINSFVVVLTRNLTFGGATSKRE